MKCLTLLVSLMVAVFAMPAVVADQLVGNQLVTNQWVVVKNDTGSSAVLIVAKSGCCKTRKSTQLPWTKTNNNFAQCETANNADKDNIYQSTGLYWWDRSC